MTRAGWLLALLSCSAPLVAFAVPDQAREITGTAVITGTVVSDTTRQPVARAIVTVNGGSITGRSAITDDAGHYAIGELPAGRFMVTASKPGYIAGSHGATRPGRPGTPVSISVDQSLTADIHIVRGAVIAGTIRDSAGDPAAHALVFPVNADEDPGTASDRLMTTLGRGNTPSGVFTDDRGQYRIFGLARGDYVIVAAQAARNSDTISHRPASEVDAIFARLRARGSAVTTTGSAPKSEASTDPARRLTLAPVYYPGTSSLAGATRLSVSAGDERTGIDFLMAAVPVTTIDGVVVSDDGRPPANVQINITSENAIHLFALATTPTLAMPPDATGRFRFSNLAPGHYTLAATANATGTVGATFGGRGGGVSVGIDDAQSTFAVASVDVSDQPVTGVTLRLQHGGRFSGRVMFDAASHAIPADLTSLRVSLSASPSGSFVRPKALNAEGTFDMVGLAPGTYRVQVTQVPNPGVTWWLRSAMAGGKDMLDSGLTVGVASEITEAVLTVTDRHSELSGRLKNESGQPAPDFYVIVFPADVTLRTAARRVQATRPATDGFFSFADLPAGEYLLAAVTDVEPDEWKKTTFLDQIAPRGVAVTLGEGEKKTQNLGIAGRF